MLSKILIATFLAMAALIIFEVIYLLFPSILPGNSSRTQTQTQQAGTPQTTQLQVTPTVTLDKNSEERLKYPAAFKQAFFSGLMVFRKNDVISGTVDIKFKGTIIEVYKKPAKIERSGYEYLKAIKFKGSGDYYEFLYLSSDAFTKTTVVRKSGNTETSMKFDDLKAGDQITMQQVVDLTRSPERDVISTKITKSN